MFIYNDSLGIHFDGDSSMLSPQWDFDGVFETLLWDGSKLLDLSEHKRRMSQSIEFLYKQEIGMPDLALLVPDLVKKNQMNGPARVRYTVSHKKSFFIHSVVVQSYREPSTDAKLVTSSFHTEVNSPLRGHKSTYYKDYAEAYKAAVREKADEAVIYNTQ